MKYFKKLICLLLVFVSLLSSITVSANSTYETLAKNLEFSYGIDVSLWNDDLDWKELKKKGIEFAYIRIGYYDNRGGHLDKRFKQNVIGCVENGIEFGVYVYSYVYSKTHNKKCAKWIHKELKKMGNYCKDKDTIQVAYDIEDNVQINALRYNRISELYLQDSVSLFCSTIKDYGYIPAVYSFSSFFNDYLDISRLQSENVKIWVAEWPYKYNLDVTKKKKLSNNTVTDIWQYSCTYKIADTIFDTNVCYEDFYDYNNENSKVTVKGLEDYYFYTGTPIKPDIEVYEKGKLLKIKKDYKLKYFKNKEPGKGKIKIIRYDENKNYLNTKTIIFNISPKPVEFLGKSSTESEVTFKWNEDEKVSYYEVYFYDVDLDKYTLLEETEENYTSLNLLNSKTKYKFKVRCVNIVEDKVIFSDFTKINVKTK